MRRSRSLRTAAVAISLAALTLGSTAMGAVAARSTSGPALLAGSGPRQVVGWGDNTGGELGMSATAGGSATPVVIDGRLGRATGVSGGSFHSAAVLGNGKVLGWGMGGFADSRQPRFVPGLSDITAVSAGGWFGQGFTLALKADGTVWAWGSNSFGELGLGTTDSDRHPPAQVPGLSGVTAVSAGGNHSLAVMSDGTVRAWGYSRGGALGGGLVSSLSPVPVAGVAGATAVAAGQDFSLALLADGRVLAWGSNSIGQLGGPAPRGSSGIGVPPQQVELRRPARSISAGAEHALAVLDNGTVAGWGSNGTGQLALGPSVTFTQHPRPVPGLRKVAAVSAGRGFSVALEHDGTVLTWGEQPQPGTWQGPPVRYDVPTLVTGLTDVVAVDAGLLHVLAIRKTTG